MSASGVIRMTGMALLSASAGCGDAPQFRRQRVSQRHLSDGYHRTSTPGKPAPAGYFHGGQPPWASSPAAM